MNHQFRQKCAFNARLLGVAPLLVTLATLTALAACAGAVSGDSPDLPPDSTPGPDASTDASDDAPADAPADAKADAYEGVIGRACELDADCGDGYRCHTPAPNGYCTVNCSVDVPCPSGSVCSPVPYSRVMGACMRPCSSAAECRPEYACDYVEAFPGDPGSPKSPVPVCWEPLPKN
ncbi:MAG TPA: hypothetical protein VK459_03450 [Polyangiaceae bacterium]|jgi:hypothetical protein|nr:hypothetical protein [Polyangiaceae bacterium]